MSIISVQGCPNQATAESYVYPQPAIIFMFPDQVSIGDAKGGIYQWRDNATDAVDTVYNSVLASPDPVNYPGRYFKIFDVVKQLPQGVLCVDGYRKILYATGTTNSSGECLMYLTMDGTATGTPIFSQVVKNTSYSKQDASITAAVSSYVKVSADSTSYVSTTHGYSKSLTTTVVLGGTVVPVQSAGSGVSVMFEVVGL